MKRIYTTPYGKLREKDPAQVALEDKIFSAAAKFLQAVMPEEKKPVLNFADVDDFIDILRTVENMPDIAEEIEFAGEGAATGGEARWNIITALSKIKEDQVLAGTWERRKKLLEAL